MGLAAEHKRAGLVPDPDSERIVYFFSGKAKIRVIQSLQGASQLAWKFVQHCVSCPPIFPFIGKYGWFFEFYASSRSKGRFRTWILQIRGGQDGKSETPGSWTCLTWLRDSDAECRSRRVESESRVILDSKMNCSGRSDLRFKSPSED